MIVRESIKASLVVVLLIALFQALPYHEAFSIITTRRMLSSSAAALLSPNQKTNSFCSDRATTTKQEQILSAATIAADLPVNSDLQTSEETTTAMKQPKVGVLLLNLGGPETEDDVEEFLYNLFADPDIIQLPGPISPLQKYIAKIISKRRAPKSREAYESIGGGSPILKYSNAQAKLLQERIQEKYGLELHTYIGMRYWHPYTEDALEEILQDKIDALVVLPLYPQFSISTSGSSLRVLQEEFAKFPHKYHHLTHTVIPSWYDRIGYIRVMAKLIQEELESYTQEQIQEAKDTTPNTAPLHVLFSAHGVPQSYIEAGDPYKEQIEECVEKIGQELKELRKDQEEVGIHLSFQSRVGPIEWLRPYTDDVLPQLGQELGVINLVVVPISFVSEHVETLEEIDIEYRELAEESGIKHWRRCPALNTDAGFIEDMADMIIDALQEPVQTVTEACVSNNVRDVQLNSNVDDQLEINTDVIAGIGGTSTEIFDGIFPKRSSSKNVELENERFLGRTAISGLVTVILFELLSGKSTVEILSGQ